MMSPEQMEAWASMFAPGQWFMFPKSFLKFLDLDEAVALSFLINLNRRNDYKITDWFYCKVVKMEKEICFNEKKQGRVLNKLKKRNLIETERRGIPSKRWVRLNIENIVKQNAAVSTPKSGGSGSPKTGGTIVREVTQDKYKIQSAPASPSRQKEESTDMGFLPTQTDNHKSTQIDRQRADALHGAIVKKGGRKIGWSRHKWADEFRRLRESFSNSGEAAKRIDDVLKWYAENIGGEYIPLVACAKSFRTKFEKLEAGLKRHRRDRPDIVPSEVAERIAKTHIKSNGWPKGSREQLPAIVEISLQHCDDFLKRLRRIEDKSKNERVRSFAKKIRSNFSGGKEAFVTRWLDKIYTRLSGWSEWSGDLKPWVFTPRHKLFDSMARGWSQDYSGTPKLWNLLTEELDA